MEKQMILPMEAETAKRTTSIVKSMIGLADMAMGAVARYYSHVLEREVSLRQAKAITEAQLAVCVLIMSGDGNAVVSLAACAWLIISLKRCKRLIRR